MVVPSKPMRLLDRLPRPDRDRPFRFLGRRVLQALADSATSNLVLGRRTAPGRFLVLRVVPTEAERERWEQQFAESRVALLAELAREVEAREIRTRTPLDLELVVMTEAGLRSEGGAALLAALLDSEQLAAARGPLFEEGECIVPRRPRSLRLESEPPGAQAYLDNRPAGVTPCVLDDVPEGEHGVAFSLPGYLFHEERVRVGGGKAATLSVALLPEPPMGVLEIRTFPPGARVTVGEETRAAPVRWRLPAGPAILRVEAPDCAPREVAVDVPITPEDRPHPLAVKLDYAGADRDEVVGRLIVYKPGPAAAPVASRPEPPPPGGSEAIRSFFRDESGEEWDIQLADPQPVPGEEVLGEAVVRRGVLLIGRADPSADLQPDVRLFDPENSVSRGCHAWLWVYADRSTGAAFNTFLIGNNSPAGIRVDGALVMETRRLAEDSVVEVGNFRLRLVKETPAPRVEFAG